MLENKNKISTRHWSHKEKARELRSLGWSYNEILTKIPAAKSSVSLWVRDVPLSEEQKHRLWSKHGDRMKGVKVIQNIFWQKRCEAFNKGVDLYVKNNNQPDFIGGLMLYWAEGNKTKKFGFTNSDEAMILLVLKWMYNFFGLSNNDFVISFNIHSGQNENSIVQHWQKLTGIPKENFRKNFIKPEGAGYRKNILYNGTARLHMIGKGSTYTLFTVLGALSAHLAQTLKLPINIEEWITKLPHAD